MFNSYLYVLQAMSANSLESEPRCSNVISVTWSCLRLKSFPIEGNRNAINSLQPRKKYIYLNPFLL